ncbi:glycosyltransferase [Laedolimicola ammoniilytica]|uniref:Glycosyltransferase n=1 Tax=Laedolimicola ammoniilytica TaxID=2981771 RepID=A0ABT2RU45_9FIRM|nr:glycosyltransferase [Laedolimicola ammoniilytica]MCU6695828.1 glycosyltransferase [Laedolimicola ammoniilytica]SCH26529.1 Glycosyl transferases group 1 [uncultured Clostridium sp.]
MEIVFIGGPLHDEAINDIRQNTKGAIWYSADIFQKKLLKGLEKSNVKHYIFSAPLIGAYPMGYRKIQFKAPVINKNNVYCVSFFNLWGVRNLSRAYQLKRAIREKLLVNKSKSYLIIVYCAHQPYLEAARYLKENTNSSKICFYVPDLPQYMNLFKHSIIYDVAKKIDIRKINNLMKNVDSFVILTEYMKDALKIAERPYFVAEGIVESVPEIVCVNEINKKKNINIVYAGGLQTAFGIRNFIDSFVKNRDTRLRLTICGAGDEEEYIIKMTEVDGRIKYLGQLLPSEVSMILAEADILINTRTNESEYTKYSFPSKNIEYLLTGKRVVACMLDGMPNCYREYIYEIVNGDYMSAIYNAVNFTEHDKKIKLFQKYAKKNLCAEQIIRKIVEQCEDKG